MCHLNELKSPILISLQTQNHSFANNVNISEIGFIAIQSSNMCKKVCQEILLAIFCEPKQVSQLFVFQVDLQKNHSEKKRFFLYSSLFCSPPSSSLCGELVLSTQKHETDP